MNHKTRATHSKNIGISTDPFVCQLIDRFQNLTTLGSLHTTIDAIEGYQSLLITLAEVTEIDLTDLGMNELKASIERLTSTAYQFKKECGLIQ